MQPPQPPPNRHPIWGSNGVSIRSTNPDCMQCGHLGVHQRFLGSCLYTLMYDFEFPPGVEMPADPNARIIRIGARLTHWQQILGLPKSVNQWGIHLFMVAGDFPS